MISACIALVVGGAMTMLPVERFTLAWTHSIEKVRWEEDYVLRSHGLEPVAARIHGNGAGMEIPEGAVWRDNVWHYTPRLAPLAVLRLARSPYVSDYEICRQGHCQGIAQLVSGSAVGDALEIRPCR